MRVKVLKGEDQVGIVEAPEDGRETGAFREAFKLGDVGRGWVVTVEDRERVEGPQMVPDCSEMPESRRRRKSCSRKTLGKARVTSSKRHMGAA